MWPWEDRTLQPVDQAIVRVDAFFELLDKLGGASLTGGTVWSQRGTSHNAVDYWCFHDRDIAPEGDTLKETNAMLDAVVDHAWALQQRTGKRVLWGTAQLFKHPRYMHGAATCM